MDKRRGCIRPAPFLKNNMFRLYEGREKIAAVIAPVVAAILENDASLQDLN
jgi:hypothetical protein